MGSVPRFRRKTADLSVRNSVLNNLHHDSNWVRFLYAPQKLRQDGLSHCSQPRARRR
jgi:predicted transcriptional regulator